VLLLIPGDHIGISLGRGICTSNASNSTESALT
jgi:hypothetical protein